MLDRGLQQAAMQAHMKRDRLLLDAEVHFDQESRRPAVACISNSQHRDDKAASYLIECTSTCLFIPHSENIGSIRMQLSPNVSEHGKNGVKELLLMLWVHGCPVQLVMHILLCSCYIEVSNKQNLDQL